MYLIKFPQGNISQVKYHKELINGQCYLTTLKKFTPPILVLSP